MLLKEKMSEKTVKFEIEPVNEMTHEEYGIFDFLDFDDGVEMEDAAAEIDRWIDFLTEWKKYITLDECDKKPDPAVIRLETPVTKKVYIF